MQTFRYLSLLIILMAGGLAACANQPYSALPANLPAVTSQPAVTGQPAVTSEPTIAVEKPQRVAMLLTQPLSPFESQIWDYVTKARDKGIASDIKLIEMKDPSEYEQTIRQVSEQGYDIVVSMFFSILDPFMKVSPDFPNVHYVMVYNDVPDPDKHPNVRGIVYDVQEGSYLCGIVAGKMTKANRVGFIGGSDNPGIVKFLAGYEAGLKSVNPNAQMDITFAGTFIDPDKGHELGRALYERGDDVIMHAANKTGLGLFVAAQELGKYAVGVDVDQSDQAPGSVICSALSNPGESVFRAIEDAATGKWSGGTVSWGLNDGVSAAAVSSIVPDSVRQAVQEAEEKIKSGQIKVPDTTTTR